VKLALCNVLAAGECKAVSAVSCRPVRPKLAHRYRPAGRGTLVTKMLLRLEEPPADQFTFPKPIAAGVETAGPRGGVEFQNILTSRHRIAARVAGVSDAVAAPDVLRVLARQNASVRFLANPVDQMTIHDAHGMTPTLTLRTSRGYVREDICVSIQDTYA